MTPLCRAISELYSFGCLVNFIATLRAGLLGSHAKPFFHAPFEFHAASYFAQNLLRSTCSRTIPMQRTCGSLGIGRERFNRCHIFNRQAADRERSTARAFRFPSRVPGLVRRSSIQGMLSFLPSRATDSRFLFRRFSSAHSFPDICAPAGSCAGSLYGGMCILRSPFATVR